MEKTFEEITAEIVTQVLRCARQTDKYRKPYAALVDSSGNREFIRSIGRTRTPLEAEDKRERAEVLEQITSLPVGSHVETRDSNECSHKHEYRDCWTRTETGWQHEQIKGRNKYGY